MIALANRTGTYTWLSPTDPLNGPIALESRHSKQICRAFDSLTACEVLETVEVTPAVLHVSMVCAIKRAVLS